jgi:putative transposase
MAHDRLPATSSPFRSSDMRFGSTFVSPSVIDFEDLLAERGLDVSYETVRRWVLKFGPLFACELRRRRPRPTARWHLDEMAVTIAGRRFWLWRAVDDEGEVLDLLVERRRDKAAALKLMRKLLKKQGFAPDVLVTDKLRSRGAAKSEIGLSARHEQGLQKNNRAENSHQPTRRREREMQRFKSPGSAQRFLSVHGHTRESPPQTPNASDGVHCHKCTNASSASEAQQVPRRPRYGRKSAGNRINSLERPTRARNRHRK